VVSVAAVKLLIHAKGLANMHGVVRGKSGSRCNHRRLRHCLCGSFSVGAIGDASWAWFDGCAAL